MKITNITVQTFRFLANTVRDAEGHGHPGPEHEATQSMTTIHTDEGVKGYCFGPITKGVLEGILKPVLVGHDPFFREQHWQELKARQRLNLATLHDRVLTTIDMALWDLAGRYLGQPVHRLRGPHRHLQALQRRHLLQSLEQRPVR